MRIKQKTLEKYARFLSLCREDEPRPLPEEQVPMDAGGVAAVEAFHLIESEGRRVGTREPLMLEKYIQGKRWHGVTVESVAEDFAISRLAFSAEIKANYPAWVANEIFTAAARIALERIGYIPTFVRDRRDFSETSIVNGEVVWDTAKP